MEVSSTETMMTNSDGAEYSIRARFDELCRQLRHPDFGSLVERPLGYWALAGDRRLPYALLERPLRDLIRVSFGDLATTPGIGKKKMASLVMLLERSVRAALAPATASTECEPQDGMESFDFSRVAEAHWELWRSSVRRHNLSQVWLGRYAPSLAAVPSVIWKAPLATYLDATLAQVRDMKAHGEKRLRGVVEVFYHIHRTLGGLQPARHLAVMLRPAFAPTIEQWIVELMAAETIPTEAELRVVLTFPLLNQLQLDGGETVGQLAGGRLGIEGRMETVISQSEQLRVTRARVYQLLDVCGEIMSVRWPEGRWYLDLLSQRLRSSDDERLRTQVRMLQHLLFPTKSLAALDEAPLPGIADGSVARPTMAAPPERATVESGHERQVESVGVN